MPFGPSTAPTFWNLFLLTTLPEKWNFFFDDIVAAISTIEEYKLALDSLFKWCYKYNLTLHIPKSDFYVQSISLLGYNISLNKIKPNIKSSQKVLNLKKPTNVKELQALLGCINYHRKFIPYLADITYPLNVLLRTKTKVIKESKSIRCRLDSWWQYL